MHCDGAEITDLEDSFYTLSEACTEVRQVLLREHDKSWYTSYEFEDVEDETGDEDCEELTIEAECPEGERVRVYIEKKKIKSRPIQAVKSLKRKAPQKIDRNGNIYILKQETQEHHDVQVQQTEVVSGQAYDNLLEANQAARAYLLEEILGIEDEDVGDLPCEGEEDNVNSSHAEYTGTVYHHNDETYEVIVRVERLGIRYSKGTVKRLGGGREACDCEHQPKKQKTETASSSKVIDLTTP